MKNLAFMFLFQIVFISNLSAAPIAQGPYLGQKPPGLIPEIFAPHLICQSNREESNGTFSVDGKMFCFLTASGVYITEQTEEGWTPLERVPTIPDNYGGWAPYLAPDGKAIYFSNEDLNVTRKTDTGWAIPERIPEPISSSSYEFGFSLAADSSFYFCSHRVGGHGGCDVWNAPCVNGTWPNAINLHDINTNSNDCGPAIAPDQSFMVLWSTRPGGIGNYDLYSSLRMLDGSWSESKNLGPKINTSENEMAASISPDGEYLFFSSRGDIYWVDLKSVLPDPNGPIENITIGQRFASIDCAINYANNGETIVLQPGIYSENITIRKNLTIQSIDPNDPVYIGGTIIQGSTGSTVVTLQENSKACEIAGLTLRAGEFGISGTGTNATIRNCRIMDNLTYGIKLTQESKPHLLNCLITANGQAGIIMLASSGRGSPPCEPVIDKCIIIGNGQAGIVGGEPVIVDSLIEE
jgi:hypothetical protein